MEKLEEAELVLERTDDLRSVANKLCQEESISYDEAFNKARNLKGVSDVKEIAEVSKYGEPTYELVETLGNIGATINGVDVATIDPEKLVALNTAKDMGADIEEFNKEMSVDAIKKSAIENRISKEKVKEKDKVLILEKPENRKDVNAA